MQKRLSLLLFLGYCTLSQGILLKPATAQVTPDGTTNTTVDVSGNDFTIQEGDRAGGNLFHSFGEFSVPTDGSAFFNNAADIVNIFSRVTGGNISNIDGLLGANGSANLFLLNPAGIIFGPNARLDIGGSFFSTTADSFLFEDGEFSATDLDNPPLLTIKVPIGLGLGDNPGEITVWGDGLGTRTNRFGTNNDLIDTENALRVSSTSTLGLVGGNLKLEGATLKTDGGRIELGSVAGNEQISFTPIDKGFSLGYEGVENFSDIQLSQTATVDASGLVSGDIQVQGNNITLTEASTIEASTLLGNIYTQETPGIVKINAAESVRIDGTSTDFNLRSGIYSIVEGESDGAAIRINTPNLAVTDGAEISTRTNGLGDGGKIIIDATESITLDNSRIGSSAFSDGDAGRLTVRANSVNLDNNASIEASTNKADGGNLYINTRDLTLQNNSLISARAFNKADGGNLDINARFILGFPSSGNGNDIIATAEQGMGGNININALQIFNLQEGQAIDQNGKFIPNNRNDIDASSDFGLDGYIAIDPNMNERLSTEVIDLDRLIAKNLCQRGDKSEFIVTGKGGMAPSPSEPRDGEISDSPFAQISEPFIIIMAKKLTEQGLQKI